MFNWLFGTKVESKSIQNILLRDFGGLSSEIMYWDFINKYILETTVGSLMCCFEYRGYDLDSSTDEELNKLVFELNKVLRELGEGWSVHLDVIRSQTKGYIAQEKNYFSNATALLIDQERRLLYEQDDTHYENRNYITFSWLTPPEVVEKINTMMFETSSTPKNSSKYNMSLLIQEYIRKLDSATATIENIFPYFNLLAKEEFAGFLNTCINGEIQSIVLPEEGCMLPAILGNKDIIVDNYPKVGNKYVRAISVYGLPQSVYPGIMNLLNSAELEFRFSTRFIFVEEEKAKKVIKKVIDKWGLKKKTWLQNIGEGFNLNKTFLK